MKRYLQSFCKLCSLNLCLILLWSCSTTHFDPAKQHDGFLANYQQLKPLPSDNSDVHLFFYKNENIDIRQYTGLIIEPVYINQSITESGISESQLKVVKDEITNNLKDTLAKKITIVNKARHNVARLEVAVTGATIANDGFKPWNILPVSLAIKLASMAGGIDKKTPVLVIETKVTDSKNKNMLLASVTEISGDSFRLSSSAPEEFRKLAQKWMLEAYKQGLID